VQGVGSLLSLTLEEILKAVEGEILIDGGIYTFSSICTDTRKIEKECIFIALKGENFNGNNFVGEASKKGARICIVDEFSLSKDDIGGNVTIIKVQDGKRALMNLAKYYRQKLNLKIIAVTGSTGKTSTKDLVAAALSKKLKVFKTKGNFNNEIGLPLMIFNIDESYDAAVLEMGMSNLGEIHNLADIARPEIALITNIGISHIENLKTRENILKAKLEITDFFSSENLLIVNGENDLLSKIESNSYNLMKIGMDEEFDCSAVNIILNEDSIEFDVKERKNENLKRIHVPVPGQHNVLNSLLAIACARVMGLEFEEIQEGIVTLEATSRRLDIIRHEGLIIVDDCYNASPDSMEAAIDVIGSINGSRKVAVLGTMKELGEKAYQYHKEVGEYAKQKNIDWLIAVGDYSEAYKEGFSQEEKFSSFENNDMAAEFLLQNTRPQDVILVKASRSMKFETIIEKLIR
jgi:UDP-N-acetylmuramoyl-tripeptide--D-alanyl-D-alanine ligase